METVELKLNVRAERQDSYILKSDVSLYRKLSARKAFKEVFLFFQFCDSSVS